MNEIDIKRILKENVQRNNKLFAPYNPLTGIGSPIERFIIKVDETSTILMPYYLKGEPLIQDILQYNSIKELCEVNNFSLEQFIEEFNIYRVSKDFEFWAATCCTIFDKKQRKDVHFVLRHAQLKLLKILVEDFFNKIPVRIILLKARQWGGSTLVQMFMAWVQIFHKDHWNSSIVALQKDQAYNILYMYQTMADNHPEDIYPVKLKNFLRSQTHKQLAGRGNIIYIGSMETPESLRSSDIAMAHLSEVGLWRETKGKKPEDVIQSFSGILDEPYTIVVKESTAKGVGNYFHHAWQDAVNGLSNDKPCFVAWFEIEMYWRAFDSEEEKIQFIETMDEDELYRFGLGATLEGLNWYRKTLKGMHGDKWRMCSEFPSTAEEAFQSTGRPAHSPLIIQQMEAFCKPPLYVGEMFADAKEGAACLDNSLRFEETPDGDFWLWALPDKTKNISNRYVVSLDIGGRSDGADWSVITVVDRAPLIYGGMEEVIGTYRFHLDQDLTIWRAVQVAKFFNDALFVPEANSLDEKEQEGDHSLTILDTIKDTYSNIFCRTDPQKIKEGYPQRYGFHTNRATKTDLVTQMNRRFREVLHIENDRRALDEARTYEIKANGSFGAVEGAHDDIYMSRAIALKASSLMPLPAEVLPEDYLANRPKEVIVKTESSW